MFQIKKTVDIKYLKIGKKSNLLFEEPHTARLNIYKSHNVNNTSK